MWQAVQILWLEKGIHQFLSQTASNAVHLSVNIDGIPLFKSSGIQFWPILAKFSHFDPFIVAIFCGQKKPSPLVEFLSDFLNEYKHLQDNGISYEDQTYTVQIEALICDAPARAYLKCIKNHNAYVARSGQVGEVTSKNRNPINRLRHLEYTRTEQPYIRAQVRCQKAG